LAPGGREVKNVILSYSLIFFCSAGGLARLDEPLDSTASSLPRRHVTQRKDKKWQKMTDTVLSQIDKLIKCAAFSPYENENARPL
jgi:hypothetical protein